MDISDPVSTTFLLPITLYIEVMQAISIQFNNFANISFTNLLIGSAAPNHHPHLQKNNDKMSELCRDVCTRRKAWWWWKLYGKHLPEYSLSHTQHNHHYLRNQLVSYRSGFLLQQHHLTGKKIQDKHITVKKNV